MQLPDDLQLAVLACLPAADLGAVCSCSRRFAALERAHQSTLWRRLHLEAWPQRSGTGTLEALQASWKTRYRLMHRRGQPPPPREPAPPPAARLARLASQHEFFIELCDEAGAPLASVPAKLSGALEEEGVLVTSADPEADGFTLSTSLLLEAGGLDACALPIGIGPAAAAGHGVGHLMPFGELQLRVYVRRRADLHLALFCEAGISLEDDASLSEAPRLPPLYVTPWSSAAGPSTPAPSLFVSNWDRGGVPFDTSALPGDGNYALLQEDVAWNTSYELGLGYEVEFVQSAAVRLWLGFLLVPGHRRDETDPATWRAASKADPEPIGVALLERILQAGGGLGAPHLDWAPP